MFIAASLGFAGLLAALIWAQLSPDLWLLWPIFQAGVMIAWVTFEGWAPWSASLGRSLLALLGFMGLQVLAILPTVAHGWEIGGAAVVGGAALVTMMSIAGLTVFALAKPTSYLEPIDPLIVGGITLGSIVLVGVGLGLPLKLIWGVPLVALTSMLLLTEIDRVCTYMAPGQHVVGGTRLFICAAVLYSEVIHYFVRILY